MKRFCNQCDLISPTFDVWGPCRECQPGFMSAVFEYGEALADIEVVKLLKVLRTSAIYEAKRKVPKPRGGLREETVLLKIAHNNSSEQIKREAVTLAKLAQKRQHPMLPVLLPPYQHANMATRPYGKTVYQGETKYYIVFQHAKGDFLRDLLIKNPQPWYQHAAWLTISVAEAMAFLHIEGQQLLLNVSPDSIMVRFDNDGIPRPLLVDLSLVSDPNAINFDAVHKFIPPAYVAPELLDPANAPYGAQTDVYGLGVLLYEMLAGHPVYPFKIRQPEDVRNAVIVSSPEPLGRTDMTEDVTQVVMKAIDKAPARRQRDILTLVKELRNKFGEVPPERNRKWIGRAIIAAAVIAVFFFIIWVALVAATGAGV
jgi:serine/threonine protein kinase